MQMSVIYQKHTKIISNAFSRSVLTDLAKSSQSIKLDEIIRRTNMLKEVKSKKYAEIFDFLYGILINDYRSEYVYKNAIATKLAIGRHRLTGVSYFSEFRAWDVVADAVLVNGTTTAYEIKTEYDSFNRLDGQLSTYQQIFDRVYVVVPEKKVSSLIRVIPINIGILVLTNNYSLSVFRESSSNIDNFSHEKIFSCLRKYEYERIIIKHFGDLPKVKPVFMRKESSNLIRNLDLQSLHDEFTSCLKSRQVDDKRKNIVRLLPKSLASLGITINLTLFDLEKLAHNLETAAVE